MKPIKSPVSFFRKQLKLKGRTQHNGRGVYEMDFSDNVTPHDVEVRIRQCIVEWNSKNLITKVAEDDKFITVELNDKMCEPSYLTQYTQINQRYRTLYFSKQYGNVGVVMSC